MCEGDGMEGTTEGPPTPEELEFEDDDGTMFVWDRTLRKYIAKELQVWIAWV